MDLQSIQQQFPYINCKSFRINDKSFPTVTTIVSSNFYIFKLQFVLLGNSSTLDLWPFFHNNRNQYRIIFNKKICSVCKWNQCRLNSACNCVCLYTCILLHVRLTLRKISPVKGKSMQSSMWHCKRSEIGAFVYLLRYLHHAIKNILHVVS